MSDTQWQDPPAPNPHVPQSVPEFAEWFRNDLAYKAPETWPGHISWFLDELVRRYKDGAA